MESKGCLIKGCLNSTQRFCRCKSRDSDNKGIPKNRDSEGRDSEGSENPHWHSPRHRNSKARDSEVRDSEDRDSEFRVSEARDSALIVNTKNLHSTLAISVSASSRELLQSQFSQGFGVKRAPKNEFPPMTRLQND